MNMGIIESGYYKSSSGIDNLSQFLWISSVIFDLLVPTAIIFSPFTAIASAIGLSLSIVSTLPLIMTRSAFSFLLSEQEICHKYIIDNKMIMFFILKILYEVEIY